MKVITFSRTFPAYHPKAGQPTYFVEAIWKALDKLELADNRLDQFINDYYDKVEVINSYYETKSKHHTIRAGNRWKAGEYFSPRVWSGKPYHSPQIIIAIDIKIENVWSIEIIRDAKDTAPRFCIDGKSLTIDEEIKLAINDGLGLEDLRHWFNKVGTTQGQIICWNKNIQY